MFAGGRPLFMSRVFYGVLICTLIIGSVLTRAGEKGDRDKAMAMLIAADSLMSNDVAKATEMCRRALAEDGNCPSAHFKLAQCLEQQNKPRDAFKSYKLAADFAKKESDAVLERKAKTAAEKLGGGLMQISVADQKLVDKLLPLADEALADEQLETARSAYMSVLAVSPAHEKAKEGLEKAEKAIDARGDPVKAKIAAAMLAEVFYLHGTGNKDDAAKMAQDIVSHHGNTAAGKEASQMLANNFEAPKDLGAQLAEAKKELKEQSQRTAKKITSKPTPGAGGPSISSSAPVNGVDVDTVEKLAIADAKKLSKDGLVPAFADAYKKGREFYSKAKPGTEGNQKNVASALEQFIRCEQFFMRIEEEKLTNDEVAANEKQASMLRYACMKMTILSH
jgi:tetratricopeptide (TPR) repeat protein